MGNNEVINKDDLHDVRDQLSEQVDRGFTQITSRLDILNGRVGKGEVTSAEHAIRIGAVEQQLRDRRNPVPDAPLPEDASALTRRDLKVAVAAIGALYVLAQIAVKLIPWLAKVAP